MYQYLQIQDCKCKIKKMNFCLHLLYESKKCFTFVKPKKIQVLEVKGY